MERLIPTPCELARAMLAAWLRVVDEQLAMIRYILSEEDEDHGNNP